MNENLSSDGKSSEYTYRVYALRNGEYGAEISRNGKIDEYMVGYLTEGQAQRAAEKRIADHEALAAAYARGESLVFSDLSYNSRNDPATEAERVARAREDFAREQAEAAKAEAELVAQELGAVAVPASDSEQLITLGCEQQDTRVVAPYATQDDVMEDYAGFTATDKRWQRNGEWLIRVGGYYMVPEHDPLDGVMTAAEAVAEYDLDESTVRQAIHRGRLPARKSGETWLIRRADAEARWGKRKQA